MKGMPLSTSVVFFQHWALYVFGVAVFERHLHARFWGIVGVLGHFTFKKNETSFLDLSLKLRVDLCKPLTDTKKKLKLRTRNDHHLFFPHTH